MNSLFLRYQYFWLALILVIWAIGLILVQSASVYEDRQVLGQSVSYWKAFCWESTSIISVFVLAIPLTGLSVKYPLDQGKLLNWVLLILCFVPFTFLHVVMMSKAREIWYGLAGWEWKTLECCGHWLYEARKDLMSYVTVNISIYLWQFIVRRVKGEAKLVHQGKEQKQKTRNPTEDRILIKKLGNEYLVNLSEVLWIEASGNYVNLHTLDSVYPMRATMAATEKRFSELNFCRVHRSTIVNMSKVESSKAVESGDYLIKMTNGLELKMSRRYKDAFVEHQLSC